MAEQALLKLREVLVEGHDLGGKGMDCAEVLGAANACVVVEARRILPASFARSGRRGVHDLFIPSRVEAADKVFGDVTVNDGVDGAALGEDAHVDVDQEKADGGQRRGGVDQHGDVAQARADSREYIPGTTRPGR